MKLVLGVDAGTQSLKCCAFAADSLELVAERSVHFDEELHKYGTSSGQVVMVDPADGKQVVRAPCLMWFEALDIAMAKLAKAVDLSRVVAISGSAQQHSSVWWSEPPGQLDPSRPLAEQLKTKLSLELSPVWADSSTRTQCARAELNIGGRAAMARKTGSISLERFTGNQISRIAENHPEEYARTKLIQLLSTALSSVLIGRPAPSDLADSAGMNMLDLDTNKWMDSLQAIYQCPGLAEKVGELCTESNQVVGNVAPFFSQRYGLPATCVVVGFTGDNPASLLGCADRVTDLVVSLGTSDTVLAQLSSREAVDVSGGGVSIFPHATRKGTYMVMICYKNGGFVRAEAKTKQREWHDVDRCLLSPPQQPVIFFNFKQVELAPQPLLACQAAFDVDSGDKVANIEGLTWEQRVFGCYLQRALAIKSHFQDFGGTADRVILTGGGSQSESVQALFQAVLGVPVLRLVNADSACRGAAIKAAEATHSLGTCNQQLIPTALEIDLSPRACSASLYKSVEAQLQRV